MRPRIDDAFDYKGIAKRRPTMLRSMQDGQHDHDFCMRGQGNITAEKLPELDTAGIVALVSNEAPPFIHFHAVSTGCSTRKQQRQQNFPGESTTQEMGVCKA